MNRFRYLLLLLGGMVAFTLIILGENLILNSETRLEQDAINRILNKLESNETRFEQIVNDTAKYGLQKIYAFDPGIPERLSKDHIYMLVYYGDSLAYWSDSRISVDSCLGDIRDGNSIMLTRNGIFQIYKKTGYYNYLCLYPIKSVYHFQNRYLTNTLNPDFDIDAEVDISLSPRNGYDAIQDKKGSYLFSVRIDNAEKIYPEYLKIGEFLLIIFLILFFEWAASAAIRERNVMAFSISCILFVIFLRGIPLWQHVPGFIYHTELFRPLKYAHSRFWSSLGDYLLNILVLIRILYLFLRYLKKHQIVPNLSKKWGAFWTLLKLMGLSFSSAGIRSLIIDSDISLDLGMYNLNGYSAILLLGIIFTLTAYLLFLDVLYFAQQKTTSIGSRLFISISAVPVLHYLLEFLWLETIIILTCFWMSEWLIQTTIFRKGFKKTFLLPLVVSVLAGFIVFHENEKKEQDIKQLFAQSMIHSHDYRIEQLIPEIDKKIRNDIKINEYIHNPDQLIHYIRSKYFGGYLNRFHINMIVADSGDQSEQVKHLDSIYFTQSFPMEHSAFVRTGVLSAINGYIGKYIINEFHQFFIILQTRPFEKESGLNELLTEVNFSMKSEEKLYSWAIYKNGSLINSHGIYNYSEKLNSNGDYPSESSDPLKHLTVREPNGITLVISDRKEQPWRVLSYIAFFISSFILFYLLLIAGNIIYVYILNLPLLYKNKKKYLIKIREDLRDNYISGGINPSLMSTRIQLTVGAIILATLAVTMLVNQQNITELYNKNQIERLTHRMRDIKPEVENLVPLKEGYIQTDFLQDKINPLSEIYQTDLNIFDLAGNLIFSTQPRIFETGIISSKMNPNALRNLRIDGKSQVIQNEHLGKLDYLSAYIPLRIHDQIIGYLNLPYFTKQAELSEAIRTNILSLITPYAVIFLLLGILSWLLTSSFVSRLNVIQEKISTTNLGRKNPKIRWHSRDEIGELVKQYNNMVDKLAKSAETLAANERNEAWQEMAKQIAHEIKNPLTPMKLNLQQMQRAFKDQHPERDEILNRVSKVLVEQIDALARLADEFSNFARLPDRNPEPLNVLELLEDLKQLFTESGHSHIHLNTPHQRVMILADELEMKRVFTNLLKNAVQAIPEGTQGEIYVNVTRELQRGRVLVSVKDNGAGIAETLKDKIFVPNFSTKNSGMGLGLAMVRKIIESSGGIIYFESSPGHGTTFFVELPTAEDSASK